MKKTIVKILKSLRSFDEDTFMHSIRVMQISLKIGEKMGLPKSQLHELAISAMLHDIGKEEIPKNVLFKNGKLSEEEFSLVKKHVKSGYVKVKYLNIPENSKTSIMYHHENENGTGYFGLKGNEIPLYAKIIHVADVYDALSNKRCYKEAMDLDIVLSTMEDDREKFDNEVYKAFLSLYK